jgi:hypothetical protein
VLGFRWATLYSSTTELFDSKIYFEEWQIDELKHAGLVTKIDVSQKVAAKMHFQKYDTGETQFTTRQLKKLGSILIRWRMSRDVKTACPDLLINNLKVVRSAYAHCFPQQRERLPKTALNMQRNALSFLG